VARPRALVIGGSVGGLFAANLLRGIGWDVEVFERAAGHLGDRGTASGARSTPLCRPAAFDEARR